MKINDMFFGPVGQIYSASIIIIILVMMFVMSFRLFISRRRKAYFSLTVSLAFIILQYFILIGLTLWDRTQWQFLEYFAQLLKVVTFLLINLAVYQLYNSTKIRQYLYFWLLLTAGALISLLYYYVPYWFNGTEDHIRLLRNIGMDLYLLFLNFLCFYFISPRIQQSGKYTSALGVYLIVQLTHLVNLYILKQPVSLLSALEFFLPILFYFILFLILFERIVELMHAIYRSSIEDGLTGLYNCRHFYARAQHLVKHEYPFSVIFSDIDNFKKLNDTQGHQMGDDVLRMVAKIITDVSEDIGIAGRYGGEEMVMLVTDYSVSPGEVAEWIRSRVERETPVTVSVGYSKYKKGLTAEELIKQADKAMYKAKTTGKNKVVRYTAAEMQ